MRHRQDVSVNTLAKLVSRGLAFTMTPRGDRGTDGKLAGTYSPDAAHKGPELTVTSRRDRDVDDKNSCVLLKRPFSVEQSSQCDTDEELPVPTCSDMSNRGQTRRRNACLIW